MSTRVCYGDFYLQDGSTTGGGFYAQAFGGPNRQTSELVHLSIGQIVVGTMGRYDIHEYLLDRRQVADLVTILVDALVQLENRKGTK